jgi:hypothetical protein
MDSSDADGFNGGSFHVNPDVPSDGVSSFLTVTTSMAFPAPPSSWTLGPGPAGFTVASHPLGGSTSTNLIHAFNPVHAFSTIHLNAGNAWPDMAAYASYISSGQQVHANAAPLLPGRPILYN